MESKNDIWEIETETHKSDWSDSFYTSHYVTGLTKDGMALEKLTFDPEYELANLEHGSVYYRIDGKKRSKTKEIKFITTDRIRLKNFPDLEELEVMENPPDVENCPKLRKLTINNFHCSRTFSDLPITELVINKFTTQYASDHPFYSLQNLETLTIIGSRKIPDKWFTYGSPVKTVILQCTYSYYGANSLTIGERSFCGCHKLTRLVLRGVTAIGKQAFWECENLSDIDWGSSLQSIGAFAFGRCESLSKVDLTGCHSLRRISRGAFSECSESLDVKLNDETKGFDMFASINSRKSYRLPPLERDMLDY